jgi:hypothetical protein
MKNDQTHILQRPLRTPRAAAIAGILFAVLQITAIVIFQVSIPADSFSQNDWLGEQSRNITLALGLMPFAGIAFLWFMGVVRDRLGHLEDQFFSTLFFGSGLLYLAMTFATAAVAGGIITIYAVDPDMVITDGFYLFGRAMIYKFNNVFAIRMAGMFMTALGTIWVRTGLMPRWLAISTYLIAFALLIGISFYPWTTLFFPVWVFVISAYILVLNYRYEHKDGVTLGKLSIS